MSNSQTDHRKELLALTGIRGLAAIAVVFSHINLHFIGEYKVPKIVYSQPFVDLFFILSGFVICYVYIEKAEWSKIFFKKFYKARFARVYPLYLFSLIIAGLVTYGIWLTTKKMSLETLMPIAIVKQLFLVNALPYLSSKMLVFTSWSVSVECWLYLLLFPILVVLKKYRNALSSPFILIVGSVGLVAYLYTPEIASTVMIGWPAVFRGVVGFTFGWLIHFHYINNTNLALISRKYCDLIAILALTILVVLPGFIPNQPWIVLIVFPYLVLGLCYNNSGTSKLLSTKPVIFLGNISYSVYLLHPIVLQFTARAIKALTLANNHLAMIVYFIIALTITVIISFFSYTFLECPLRNFLQKKLKYSDKKKHFKTWNIYINNPKKAFSDTST